MPIPTADRLNSVGEYFFSRKLRQIAHLKAQGKNIIDLGIGSPDLPPSTETMAQLCEVAKREGNHGYQPYNGRPELRAAFADWYKRIYSVELDPDSQVLPLAGSKEGIFHISSAFLNPGDKALIPDPGYPTYSALTRLSGATPVYYNLTEETNWLPDLDALSSHDLSRVKIMWVNYPHMPTGAVASGDDFTRLLDFARTNQILICHDNPYSLILNSEPRSILSCPQAFDCSVELNSLSKSHHMAGWRVGLVAGAAEHIQSILAVKSNMDSGMFSAIQYAAITALQNSTEWHQLQNEIYGKRRHLLSELMQKFSCSYHPDRPGLFVWGMLPPHIDDVSLFLDEILQETGVFLTPGMIFGNNGARYMRASLCANEIQITEAINRIASYLGVDYEQARHQNSADAGIS